jgi:hypothetical protein
MSIKTRIYKYTNSIEELSTLLSDRIWKSDHFEDQFYFAALVDSINLAASKIEELVEMMPYTEDAEPQAPEQDATTTAQ